MIKMSAIATLVALVLGAILVQAQEGQDINKLYADMNTAYSAKQYDQAVSLAEQILALPELEKVDKKNQLQIRFILANSLFSVKKDLDKAIAAADALVGQVEEMKGNGGGNQFDRTFLVPGMQIRFYSLVERFKASKNAGDLVQAADTLWTIYEQYDQKPANVRLLVNIAQMLSSADQRDKAIELLEKLSTRDLGGQGSTCFHLLATNYSKKGDKARSITYLQKAYDARRIAKYALDLGQMLFASKDVDGAIRYLAEAYVLDQENANSKAYKTLRHLIYNVKGKDKGEDELDSMLKDAVAQARTRVKG